MSGFGPRRSACSVCIEMWAANMVVHEAGVEERWYSRRVRFGGEDASWSRDEEGCWQLARE